MCDQSARAQYFHPVIAAWIMSKLQLPYRVCIGGGSECFVSFEAERQFPRYVSFYPFGISAARLKRMRSRATRLLRFKAARKAKNCLWHR
jgi:hypothetical protein